MKFIELIRLKLRANKYKNKNDKGGISYLLSSIKAGQTAFDIGSHKAGYLYFMHKQVGKDGKVYAFEPQSILYNYIKKLIRIFHWQNVTVEHMALSDEKGMVKLYNPLTRHRPAPGATIVSKFDNDNIGSTEDVLAETLDNYCDQKKIKPDFLKIDVEGNELRVLKGGIETLKKHKPKILVECEAQHIGREKMMETFNFLQGLGYKGIFISGTEYISISEFNPDVHQNLHSKTYSNNFIFE